MDRRAFAYVVEDAYACTNQESSQDKPSDHPEISLNDPPAYQDCVEAPRRLQRQHSSQFPPLPNPTQLASMTSLSRISSTAAINNNNNKIKNMNGRSSRPLHWFGDESDESAPTSLSSTAHSAEPNREFLLSETSSHSLPCLDHSETHPLSSGRRLTRTSSERSVAEQRLRKARDEQQRILEEIQRSSSSKKVESKPSPEISERIRVMKEQQQLIMERIQGGSTTSIAGNESQGTNDIQDSNSSSGLEHISEFVILEQFEILSQIEDETSGLTPQGQQQEYQSHIQEQQEHQSSVQEHELENARPSNSHVRESFDHIISACDGGESDREKFIREQQEILDAILRQRH